VGEDQVSQRASARRRPLMTVQRIDHVVLTVADLERSIAFYERVLIMTAVTFGEGRHALTFGDQKLNLHHAGREFSRRREGPRPGRSICA